LEKRREKVKMAILQAFFPLHCPVCDKIVRPAGEKICRECERKLRLITPPWCMKCGKKLQEEGMYCPACRARDRAFERGRALYEYNSAADAIYRFKYGGRQEYAAYFGEQMGEYLGEFIRSVRPDALVPVPLHKSRMRKRGYNQAQLLAKQIGRQFHIPVCDKLLIRQKNTRPLKEMNARERQNNLKKAFKVTRNDVKLEMIVVVDDIYTTGSTVEEAARTLKSAGAKKVYFLTLAAVADGGRL
jgi:ComF family protein